MRKEGGFLIFQFPDFPVSMLNQRLRLLSYVVMAYMLLAFTWWALLLFTKNRDAFYAKRDLLKIGMAAEGLIENNGQFEQTADFQKLQDEYQRQERMIFGEASVFVLTLLAGLWFIHRSYYRMAQTSQQQRNFLLSITHELKSPIASIRLVLETILKRDLPKAKADLLAEKALRENERLYQLVENLLLSAKLESAYQPELEETDLGEMVEDLLAKQASRQPDATITFDQSGPIPLLHLDQNGITLLVNNLVENAVKYSEGPAKIDVRLSVNGANVQLEVADQGIGIPDAEKKQVFQKFYRVGSEETRTTKGTGLGLFIVNEIVKTHGGKIRVKDNVPQGTRFLIELPLNKG